MLRHWAERAAELLEQPRKAPQIRSFEVVKSEFFRQALPDEAVTALAENVISNRATGSRARSTSHLGLGLTPAFQLRHRPSFIVTRSSGSSPHQPCLHKPQPTTGRQPIAGPTAHWRWCIDSGTVECFQTSQIPISRIGAANPGPDR